MKKLVYLLTAMAALAFCSTANASITNATWGADQDGAIVCHDWSWNSASSSLWMYGDQSYASGQPGHMVGSILTDDPQDPTLTLGGTIGNDTGYTWIGYQINVIMNTSFSFGPPVTTVGNPPINDWVVGSTVAPTLQASGTYAGLYLGTLNFSSGTPIDPLGDMTFSYAISFSGGLSFNFTQEMLPQYAPIPEPSTAVLAGIGGLMFAFRLCRGRRA